MGTNKVIIISSVFPYPIDTGKKVVLSGMLSFLRTKYSAEDITYILIGADQTPLSFPDDEHFKVFFIKKPNWITQLGNVVWFSIIRQRKSIQEALLYSTRIKKEIQGLLQHSDAGLVIYDTVRTGQYRDGVAVRARSGAKYVLYMEDLFSVRYQKMVDSLEAFPDIKLNPLGNFLSFVPRSIQFLAQIGFIRKMLFQIERVLISRSEQRSAAQFDEVLLLNGLETARLQEATGTGNVRTIKPLLNTAVYEMLERRYTGRPDFIFIGSLKYPQNQIAIEHFISTVMDAIIKKIPDVKLKIIGTGADKDLFRLADQYKGHIFIEGYVKDINTVFSESCALIVPLLFGSGIKLKTLEALFRGLPVICTEFGVEGIPVTNGIHCLVDNDLSHYPDLMKSLCDVDRNRAMSRSAKELFAVHYSRRVVEAEYECIFCNKSDVDSTVSQQTTS